MPASPSPPACGLIPGADSDEVMPNCLSRTAGRSAASPGFFTMDWPYPKRKELTIEAPKIWVSSIEMAWFGSRNLLVEVFKLSGLDHEELSRYQLEFKLSLSVTLMSPRSVT